MYEFIRDFQGIFLAAISAGFGALFAYTRQLKKNHEVLNTKIIDLSKQIEILTATINGLDAMRESILAYTEHGLSSLYKTIVEKKYISEIDFFKFRTLFKRYKMMGGNGKYQIRYKRLKKMYKESTQKIEDIK